MLLPYFVCNILDRHWYSWISAYTEQKGHPIIGGHVVL